MGHEAIFNITWDGDKPDPNEVARRLAEGWGHTREADTSRAADLIHGRCSARWLNWDDDLRTLSLQWPETTFTAERRDAAAGEHLAAYFQNGRSYQVCLRPPPFNQALLECEQDRPDLAAHVQYRFVEVPEEAGKIPWRQQVTQDHPVTEANRRRLNHEVTFLFGTMAPPRDMPSSGARCIHHNDENGAHDRAVAWTWQYDIPAENNECYTGFAGYCGVCLTRSYGILLDQVRAIFGLG